jgi:hypothetical protein
MQGRHHFGLKYSIGTEPDSALVQDNPILQLAWRTSSRLQEQLLHQLSSFRVRCVPLLKFSHPRMHWRGHGRQLQFMIPTRQGIGCLIVNAAMIDDTIAKT